MNAIILKRFVLWCSVASLLSLAACRSPGDGDSTASGEAQLVAQPGRKQHFEACILTYNIELGLQRGSGKRIADLLRGVEPDIICLQEVAWPSQKDAPSVANQADYLADVLGYSWATARRGRLENESYGMAVLVRGNITRTHSLQLPHDKTYALAAEVTIDGHALTVVSVHAKSLGQGARITAYLRTESHRKDQAAHLLKSLDDFPRPVVVAGDFNTLPDSPSYTLISKQLKDAAVGSPNMNKYTRLTNRVPARIDYIFVDRQARINAYDVLPVDYSDHRPVIATVRLEHPEPPANP